MNKIIKIIPGVLVCFLVAFVAQWIEELLPIHMIGASIIAMFLGMFGNHFFQVDSLKEGFKFTSKKLLKLAIILLGASLSIQTILTVGRMSLTVMFFTLLTCFGGGYFIGKLLGLDWKISNLISAGTGICGGSAIAAIAPVIEAKDEEIAYAMSATFIFDMLMILAFPIMGNALGLSDMAYGLWAGTAVNDTSSVVAAGYAFSEAAGDFATMVKLTRTLAIIPTVVIFACIHMYLKKKENQEATKLQINAYEVSQTEQIGEILHHHQVEKKSVPFLALFPWFIVGFVMMAILNSLGYIPSNVSLLAKDISKFLMVAALAAIGFHTSFKDMKQAGTKPMLHGFIISLLVVIVAIVVEYSMGLV
ncbi:YeiH family protein [Tannockella kyphosi]|uniref:YeiH family protein n=1 Tax=Tannockella kyphosi TaxID=2899121 RepID=UPI002011F7CC|nr:putative sulfate exporter family transporter [Tannockella kyphosi]